MQQLPTDTLTFFVWVGCTCPDLGACPKLDLSFCSIQEGQYHLAIICIHCPTCPDTKMAFTWEKSNHLSTLVQIYFLCETTRVHSSCLNSDRSVLAPVQS